MIAAKPQAVSSGRSLLGGRRADLTDQALGGLIAVLGLVLAGAGMRLALFGDSLYYMLAGLGYAASGVMIWRRRPGGTWLAVALLVATVGWTLWEVGLDYWALLPRLMLPAGLALLALIAAIRFDGHASRREIRRAVVLALMMAVYVSLAFVPHSIERHEPVRPFATAPA